MWLCLEMRPLGKSLGLNEDQSRENLSGPWLMMMMMMEEKVVEKKHPQQPQQEKESSEHPCTLTHLPPSHPHHTVTYVYTFEQAVLFRDTQVSCSFFLSSSCFPWADISLASIPRAQGGGMS